MSDLMELAQAIRSTIPGFLDASTVEAAHQRMAELIQTPLSVLALIHLSKSEVLEMAKNGTLTFLYKSLTMNWPKMDPELRGHVESELIELCECPFASQHLPLVADCMEYVYVSDENGWKALVDYAIAKVKDNVELVALILRRITKHFDGSMFAEMCQWFLDTVMFYLSNELVDVRIAAIVLFNVLLSHVEEPEGLEQVIIGVNATAQNSLALSNSDFADVWSAIGEIIGSGKVPIDPLVETALQIAGNRDRSSTERILPVTALVNGLDRFSKEMGLVLQLTLDVIAQTIVETESLPFEETALLEQILAARARVESYPVFIARILEDMKAGERAHVAAALIALKVVLTSAPDCVQKDANNIVGLLETAIASGDPLIVQAAAAAIESFEDSFSSLTVFGMNLIAKLVPFILNPSVEVRHHCYRALLALCGQLDCKVPQIFSTVWSLNSKITPDDVSMYFCLLAYAIQLEPDLCDEEIDVVLALLERVNSDKSNPVAIAGSFNVAHALIQKDSDQTEDVLKIVGGSIGPCLNFDNDEVVAEAISFMNNMLKYDLCPASLFAQFLDKVAEYAFCQGRSERVQCSALLLCCHVVVEMENPGELFEKLVQSVTSGLELDDSELQITSIQSVSVIAKALNDAARVSFFKALHTIIEQGVNIQIIEESIKSMTSIIQATEDKKEMIEAVNSLLTAMINGDVAFLGHLPLIEIDTSPNLFSKICRLISATMTESTPLPESVCSFLLEWLKRDSELDKSPAIEALSDAVLYDAVSSEVREAIIGAVVAIIPNAEDPAAQENIIYLLNVLIMKQTALVQPIFEMMPIFSRWWATGIETRSGYQDLLDNLASLFIILAIYVPTFPEEILCQVLSEIPQSESETTGPMCRNLCQLLEVRANFSAAFQRQLALAVARIFMCDKNHLEMMNMDAEILTNLQNILVSIVRASPAILQELEGICRKSKSRAKRLAGILCLS